LLPSRLSILLFVLFLPVASSYSFSAPQPPALKLGDEVQPKAAVLNLTLSPEKPDFSGTIQFDLKINEAVDHFWLNAVELSVTSASLSIHGKTIPAQIIPGGDDFVGFQFPAPVHTGSAHLTVSFSGKINQKSSQGIFQSNRNEDKYVFTQFEAISARRAFPCFDQPNFKIPWRLTLHVRQSDSAVANTKILKETPEAGGMKAVEFTETKPLPSYLVAFGVGPFEYVDAGTTGVSHVPVRIVVPKGDSARAKYAASITAEIITWEEKYYGIPYPYDKADQLAIPLSFGGAMENPGLVTYDANIILAPPGQESLTHQRTYASIAAHELGHQWTGDLVTMKWWDDVWLNEAFATWMSSKMLAEWKPEWQTRADDQESRQRVMVEDTKTTARRINQPVNSKSDIANAFDDITYEKGGSVLATFENAIGPENFRRAMHNYLQAHAFGNATTDDFLAALAGASKPEYATAFRTFLDQIGVPEVKTTLACTGANAVLNVEQQRLLPVGSTGDVHSTWGVPVCVAYGNGSGRAQACKLVSRQRDDIPLPGSDCPAWYLANAGEIGFYEAEYDGKSLNNLLDHHSDLSLAEQVGLLGDISTLETTGQIPWEGGLAVVGKLKDDNTPKIVRAEIKLATVPMMYVDAKVEPEYASFVENAFGEKARRLGWLPKPGDSEEDQLLRPQLVGFVVRWGKDPELLAEARRLGEAWLADHKSLPLDVARSVLSCAARYGDAQFYDKLLAAAKAETDPSFKRLLISRLGDFLDPQLVRRSLGIAFDGTFDARLSVSILFSTVQQPATANVSYQYVRDHYDAVRAELPSSVDSDYASLLPFLASASQCSIQGETEARDFFEPRMKNVVGGPRRLASALEDIHLCAAAKPDAERDIASFLSQYGGTQSAGER
jgi:cytosol alanyl aminopeptidase